jgi:large subunit ribosomal protein L24
MKSKWLKKGDKVCILSGNDKGKVGEILFKREDRVVVQGVNIRKRHMKARSQKQKSEIVSMEMPIHASNVTLCDSEGKKLKVRVEQDKEKGKELIYVKGKKELERRTLRKAKV